MKTDAPNSLAEKQYSDVFQTWGPPVESLVAIYPEANQDWQNPKMSPADRTAAFLIAAQSRIQKSQSKKQIPWVYHVTDLKSAHTIVTTRVFGIPLGTEAQPNICCNTYAGAHCTKSAPDEGTLDVLQSRMGENSSAVLRMLLPPKLSHPVQVERLWRYAPHEVPLILRLVDYLKQCKNKELLKCVEQLPTTPALTTLEGNVFSYEIMKRNDLALRVMIDSVCGACGEKPNFWAYSRKGVAKFLPDYSRYEVLTSITGSHRYVTLPGVSDCSLDLFTLLPEYHKRLIDSAQCIDHEYAKNWEMRLQLFSMYLFNYDYREFHPSYWYLWPSENRLGVACSILKNRGMAEIADQLSLAINGWFYKLLKEKQTERYELKIPPIGQPMEPGGARDGFVILTQRDIRMKMEVLNNETQRYEPAGSCVTKEI